MNDFERSMLRMQELHREYIQIPQWAKAEKLERTVQLNVIWAVERKEKGDWLHELIRKK